MRSLRRRALYGAALWSALSVAVGFFALLTFFNNLSAQRFDASLLDQHRQVVIALGNSGGDGGLMEVYLTDPEYARTYSGRYWQLDGPDGEVLTSRSLFDAVLAANGPATETPAFWNAPGPDGPLRGVAQRVTLEDGGEWVVRSAASLSALALERSLARRSLFTAFALVGVLIVAGGLLQIRAVLKPLGELRADVARRWEAGEALEPGTYPEEVAPLVSDINHLLARNRTVIDGARRQAADLAHALKTPTAILRNEIERRSKRKGELAEAREALDRIDAQILRSLARIRAGNAAAAGYRTNLKESADRLARLFRGMPGAEALDLEIDVPSDLSVAMDRQDVEEVLGNLIENAQKWRRRSVRVSAFGADGAVTFHVDDDGPGIPPERREEALRAGGRLDTSSAGTGLGLAIAHDLVTAYEGTIRLDAAPELGGLRVTVTVPEMRSLMERGPATGGA